MSSAFVSIFYCSPLLLLSLRYVTVMKMFFAMGMTWLAEVVAFAIDWGHAGNAAFGSGNDIVNFCKIIISLQVPACLLFMQYFFRFTTG